MLGRNLRGGHDRRVDFWFAWKAWWRCLLFSIRGLGLLEDGGWRKEKKEKGSSGRQSPIRSFMSRSRLEFDGVQTLKTEDSDVGDENASGLVKLPTLAS